MKAEKIRKFVVQGTAIVTGTDGELHHKLMVRVGRSGRRRECWIDTEHEYSIGDTVLVKKNPVYTIVPVPGGGDNDVRSDDENQ